MVFGFLQIVGACGIELPSAVKVLAELILLVIPLTDLLIGPLVDTHPHIGQHEVHGLVETGTLGRDGIVDIDTHVAAHLEHVNHV